MSVLPKEVAYEPLVSLPNGTNALSVVVSPANVQDVEAGGDVVHFDIPSRGFLVPESLYISFKMTAKNAVDGTAGTIRGAAAYAPWARVETLIGGQQVETMTSYNQLTNMLINTKMSVAAKVGMGYSLGIGNRTGNAPAFNDQDGFGGMAATGLAEQSFDFAAPLGCILSNASKLVPLGMMPSVRISLTTDALSNFTSGIDATGGGFKLSNLQLCMDIVDFGAATDEAIKSLADEEGNVNIRSQSFVSATQNLPAAQGQTELVYNQRLSSIKTIVAIVEGANQNTNGKFDAIDPTRGEGDVQFLIASEQYPPRPLSMSQNSGRVYQELADAWSPTHSLYNTHMAIVGDQFGATDETATTYDDQAKNYFAVNTERLSTNGNLLTGVSSMLSPLSLRINKGSAGSASPHATTLICCYDAILSCNLLTRQASVKQ